MTDGPARGWLHTHGLSVRGLPELETRNVPLFLGNAAAGVLNDFADYLLNEATAPLLAGISQGLVHQRDDPRSQLPRELRRIRTCDLRRN